MTTFVIEFMQPLQAKRYCPRCGKQGWVIAFQGLKTFPCRAPFYASLPLADVQFIKEAH